MLLPVEKGAVVVDASFPSVQLLTTNYDELMETMNKLKTYTKITPEQRATLEGYFAEEPKPHAVSALPKNTCWSDDGVSVVINVVVVVVVVVGIAA